MDFHDEEEVFGNGETRILANGNEEVLLYSAVEPGFKERMQIRYVGAGEYTAELRINTEQFQFDLWTWEALYRLADHAILLARTMLTNNAIM